MADQQLSYKKDDEIKFEQLRLLQETLSYIYQNSAFYKKHFALNNAPKEINSLEDLQHFPLTSKEDLQSQNDDFFCASFSNINEVMTTSGTLGKPVNIALTYHDLNRLALNEQYSFEGVGITQDDRVQLLLTLDKQFMAGMAYYSGLKNIGATIIRTGPGIPLAQWETTFKYRITTWVAVPSFVVKLLEYAQKNNIDYKESTVQKIICIGEPIRNANGDLNALGQKISDMWQVELFSTYASTEMQAAFTECNQHEGCHSSPELIYTEILDQNFQSVAHGEIGEIVVTTLGLEGTPLWRYRTGDLAKKIEGQCACGKNGLRISSIVGRKQQLIKFKGTTIYPQSIFEILNQLDCVDNYVVKLEHDDYHNDHVTILYSTNENVDSSTKTIIDTCLATIRVRPNVELINREELIKLQFPENSRKLIRLLDLRTQSCR